MYYKSYKNYKMRKEIEFLINLTIVSRYIILFTI